MYMVILVRINCSLAILNYRLTQRFIVKSKCFFYGIARNFLFFGLEVLKPVLLNLQGASGIDAHFF
jgi:hypothetical protein